MIAKNKIKAIETPYKGIRFRSRLEARWAAFMDVLGVKWEYEPEGFTDGSLCYLPDFWLPGLECYLEVKPLPPDDEEYSKAWMLVSATARDLFFAIGRPGKSIDESYGGQLKPILKIFTENEMDDDPLGNYDFVRCRQCGAASIAWLGVIDGKSCRCQNGQIDRESYSNAVYAANNTRFGENP